MKLPSTNSFATIVNAYDNPVFLKDGGQKQVYKVVHPSFGESVLKVGIYHSRQGLERIKREVLLLRDIDSIYYPKNYDFKIHQNFVFEIIEEFVESTPLTNLLSSYNLRDTVLLIRHLVEGLRIIWEKRTVHRDIKPDNILITLNGTPKIIDLGIARQLDLNSITHTLQARGPCTPFYAAPEQLSNRKTEIKPRTDQFNLGIIMVQLLLKGKHPFDPDLVGGNGTSILDNLLSNSWDKSVFRDSSLKPLEPIAEKLLGHEPYQRYRNAEMLIDDLDRVLEELEEKWKSTIN